MEQLGYIVWAGADIRDGIPGFRVEVQVGIRACIAGFLCLSASGDFFPEKLSYGGRF